MTHRSLPSRPVALALAACLGSSLLPPAPVSAAPTEEQPMPARLADLVERGKALAKSRSEADARTLEAELAEWLDDSKRPEVAFYRAQALAILGRMPEADAMLLLFVERVGASARPSVHRAEIEQMATLAAQIEGGWPASEPRAPVDRCPDGCDAPPTSAGIEAWPVIGLGALSILGGGALLALAWREYDQAEGLAADLRDEREKTRGGRLLDAEDALRGEGRATGFAIGGGALAGVGALVLAWGILGEVESEADGDVKLTVSPTGVGLSGSF